MMASTHPSPERSGRWIPWIFVGFLGVTVSVNAVMIWFAMQSWTGLVTAGAYDKGLAYNRNLAAEARQVELGWQARFTARITEGYAAEAMVELRDRDGRPLTDAEVIAAFQRPASELLDFEVQLRPTAPGEYRAELVVPAVGLWMVHLTARRGEDLHAADHRLILR